MPTDNTQNIRDPGSETTPLGTFPTVVDAAASQGSDGASPPGSSTTQELRNIPERYERPETIGTGGIGIVTSCVDPNLGRRVALKTLRRKYSVVDALRLRFVREARVMSQLEHPNIVPVHELGERPDGTVYFTMKQVQGESLEWVCQRLADRDPDYLRDYPLTRLLDIFVHICQAIAFAHSRGVIHRDLKPENIMIGSFGEVQIMDWGLVKIVGGMDRDSELDVIHSEDGQPTTTMEGQVAGTPLYMAPEQARGQIDKLDQRTDVYGLGAILYRLLARQSYLSGKDVHTILELVKTATPLPPHRVRGSSLRVPRELSAICMKALAKEQSDRYQTVQAMIDDLERFERGLPVSVYRPPLPARLLKFCRRHPLVGMVVVTAVSLGIVIMITGTAVRYQRHLGMLSSARSYKEKGDQAIGLAMAVQDRLNHLRAKQRLKTATIEEGALTQRLETLRKNSDSNYDIARLLYAQAMEFGRAPGFDLLELLRRGKDGDSSLGISEERLRPICHEVVDTYRRQIDCALLGGDYAETQRLFELMQPWYLSTPGNYSMDFHYWRAQTRKFLEGYGSLKVEIDVPEAEIAVYRLAGDLSPPNLDRPDLRGAAQLPVGALPHGSYLVTITAEGYPTVTVPVAIEHAEERAIRLSVPRDLPDDMAYVPSGPTIVGGPASPLYRQKEIWLPGFLMKRHEVTMAEYLEFWLSLETNADREACMAYVQFSEGAYSKTPSWNERGEITHPLTPRMPIVGISKAAADAYCAWLAARLGREVRLPTADEWEKAARGADGRIYPWGNGFRSDYAHLEETQDGIGVDIYAEPGSYPMDCSVYGILDLGGNVREWTATPFPDSPRRFQIKGGSLATSRRHAASAYADMTPAIPTDVGFRYIMPLDDAAQ